VAVGGGDPDHLLAADELDHPLVQPLKHLLAVEAVGPVLRPELALERMLAVGAGPDEPHLEVLGLDVTRGRFAHLAMVNGRVVRY
jgi:hypothetical protein